MKDFEYKIPQVIDEQELDQSNIKVTVTKLNSSLMVYDEQIQKITFLGLSNEKSGNYTIQITLEDSFGLTTSYDMTFEILPYQI